MRVKTTYFFLAFILAAASGAFAQKGYISNVTFNNQSVVKESSQVSVSIDILLDDLDIESSDLLILTPVIQSEDNANSLELAPLFVTGSRRDKVLKRNIALGNKPAFDNDPLIIVAREKGAAQTVSYNTNVPYSSWMTNSSLVVKESVRGCADCTREMQGLLLADNIFPIIEMPDYQLTYIVPAVEPVKGRAEHHTAAFNFMLDDARLLRDYKGNRPKFEEVDRIIREVMSNDDLEITEFNIAGYASPEAPVAYNRILAEKRANIFAHYLVTQFNLSEDKFTVESFGEDWNGLQKAVEASNIADKAEVLRIIDTVENPDARDEQLMNLSGGSTYNKLLYTFYPPLRRTEYTIAYTVRSFEVEEAKGIIESNPQLLSLSEMYMVAQSYGENSKEYKEVFKIAERTYPDNETAILNSAAVAINNNDLDHAITQMQKMGDNAKAWNNLGVAYALNGELQKALQLLNKAAAANDADAVRNLEKLEEYMRLIE